MSRLTRRAARPSDGQAVKIQIASDLHLEFGNRTVPAPHAFRSVADRDVLVLAGDIGRERMARVFVEREVDISPVIYVPGNHEYYSSHSRASIDESWRALAAELDGLHYLVADSVTIGGVRFWGVPWYSDLWGTTDPWGPGDGAHRRQRFLGAVQRRRRVDAVATHQPSPGAVRPTGDPGRPGRCCCHALAADQGGHGPEVRRRFVEPVFL